MFQRKNYKVKFSTIKLKKIEKKKKIMLEKETSGE